VVGGLAMRELGSRLGEQCGRAGHLLCGRANVGIIPIFIRRCGGALFAGLVLNIFGL
jgi:hypothetical protein